MSDLNSDLIVQEVDDEVRSERMRQLWAAYGKYVIGLAVAIVILVGGREGYTSYVESKEQASSAAFEAAIKAAEADSANAVAIWQKALPTLEGGYNGLGNLRLADAAAANGDAAAALAAYDQLINDSSADKSLRDMAQLYAGMLLLRGDSGQDLAGARTRLSTVATDNSAWYHSALEQLAFTDTLLGDKEVALNEYRTLVQDENTPATIRARAEQMRDALEAELGINQFSVPDETADPAAETATPDDGEAGASE